MWLGGAICKKSYFEACVLRPNTAMHMYYLGEKKTYAWTTLVKVDRTSPTCSVRCLVVGKNKIEQKHYLIKTLQLLAS